MPCTACGSAQSAKHYQLENKKVKKPTTTKYVTPQQAAAIRAYYTQCARRRRTMVFT